MTIDKEKYDYTPYRGPNVVHKTEKTIAEKLPLGLAPDPILAPVVDRLVKYHPEWTFVSIRGYTKSTASQTLAYCYMVYQGTEYLGHISCRYRGNKLTVRLEGPRVSADTVRGRGKETSDTNKAIKLAEKYFCARTLRETMADAAMAASAAANDFYGVRQRAFSTAVGKLTPAMLSYVLDNLPSFSAHAAKLGVENETLDGLQKIVIEREEGLKLRNSAGFLVMTQDGRYILQAAAKGITSGEADTVSELPVEMRRKLGLLKLMDPGVVLPDVGIRLAQNKFFITGEGE